MSLVINTLKKIKRCVVKSQEREILENYYHRFLSYAFVDGNCKDQRQYEASITRWYHTIEKGLAYENYRAGFGKDNIAILLDSLEKYSKNFDTNAFFYKTALSTLHEYVKKNEEYGLVDNELIARIKKLPGEANNSGGIINFSPPGKEELREYKEFIENRHSLRHFSDEPVDIGVITESLKLAQHTPSACNRQGWKTYVLTDEIIKNKVLDNQNGNRGFGNEIDKLIAVVGDIRCSNIDREVFQVFIDGGMYAMRIIDCLHYNGLATIPLSGALRPNQDKNIRDALGMKEYEEIIMFIGVGNYPKNCTTTKSERRYPEIKII